MFVREQACLVGLATDRIKNAPAMSLSSRSRFLPRVVGDQIAASMLSPTNQRYSTL
jgi:hypothetical protein